MPLTDSRLPWRPRTLRRQFLLAVTALALLILAGGVTALYALRVATDSTRLLAEERLVHMQEAQDLVQHTLLIERESYKLAGAESAVAMRAIMPISSSIWRCSIVWSTSWARSATIWRCSICGRPARCSAT